MNTVSVNNGNERYAKTSMISRVFVDTWKSQNHFVVVKRVKTPVQSSVRGFRMMGAISTPL